MIRALVEAARNIKSAAELRLRFDTQLSRAEVRIRVLSQIALSRHEARQAVMLIRFFSNVFVLNHFANAKQWDYTRCTLSAASSPAHASVKSSS